MNFEEMTAEQIARQKVESIAQQVRGEKAGYDAGVIAIAVMLGSLVIADAIRAAAEKAAAPKKRGSA